MKVVKKLLLVIALVFTSLVVCSGSASADDINELVVSDTISHTHTHSCKCNATLLWKDLSDEWCPECNTYHWTVQYCPTCGAVYKDTRWCTCNGRNVYVHHNEGVCDRVKCTLPEGVLANINVYKKVIGNVYTLTAEVSYISDSYASRVSTVGSWDKGGDGFVCTVTSNETYSYSLSYTINGVTETKVLSYEVTDFDDEPPVISSVGGYTGERTNGDIVLTPVITDNLSGVRGFSVNGCDYIISEISYTVTENGEYKFTAIDNNNNVTPTSYDVTVDTIDKNAPIVDSVGLS